MNISWDAEKYREGFSFVSSYGEDVLKLLTVQPGSQVVDLGCGNGALSEKLREKGYRVMGIDASDEMLCLARREHPKIPFKKADAAEFHLDTPCDAIFSNAVMHWIDAGLQRKTLQNISANLCTGGEFVFEFGGHGCAETVHAGLEEVFKEHGRVYRRVFYFPTIGEYAPLVEENGMRVNFAALFNRPTPQKDGRTVKDWIRMFDKKPFEGIPEDEIQEILSKAEDRLRGTLCIDGTWYIDYVRIRMRAQKV